MAALTTSALLASERAGKKLKQFARSMTTTFEAAKMTLRDFRLFAKTGERCAAAAKLEKHATSYALRRTTNNRLRRELGVIEAQAVTGHATQDITEHYSEVEPDEKREALGTAFGFLKRTGTLTGQKPVA